MSRSGFVALAGRPNAGKSTLVNRIVGGKVAIVSDKPQTTRREIRGVATGDGWQLVLVDLPGVQRPRDALTERMQRQVERALADADAALFVLNGEQEIGPGDRFIAEALKRAGVPTVTVLNKVDRLDRGRTLRALTDAAELELPGELFPISAKSGVGVGPVVEELVSLCRRGRSSTRPRSGATSRSSSSWRSWCASRCCCRTREELPHAVEAEVDEIEERDDGLMVVRGAPMGRDRVAERNPRRRGRPDGAGGGHRRAQGDRGGCSTAACTWT